MKIIVISEETRQRLLSEDPMLDAIDSSKTKKEKELEKKKKEEEMRKKKEEEELKKKNEKNDAITTNNDKKDENKVDTNKVDTNKVDTNKVDTNKVDTNKPEYKIDKSTPTMKDFQSEPVKPTNPSGKVIPKPTKPLMKNSPAAKAGIPIEKRQKFANQIAAFQATKNKDSGYTKMDFIKDFPSSQTAKKFNKGESIPGFSYKKNLKYSYEPYDLVLDYVLSEGHADNIEEAHYVMMQMDEETIQTITEIKKRLIGGALLATPFVMQKIKDKFDPIGNKRKEFQQKKKEKYEKLSGTQGQGYFD